MVKEFKNENAFLSNFYPCKIIYEGIEYPTTEHAFQAAKTLDIEKRKKISLLSTPREAKIIGNYIEIRQDWEQIKLQIMYDICKLKFKKPFFENKLKNTLEEDLIEGNTWDDIYWGKCNNIGENHLGKILMRIRSEIKEVI